MINDIPTLKYYSPPLRISAEDYLLVKELLLERKKAQRTVVNLSNTKIAKKFGLAVADVAQISKEIGDD
jgi:hypothetical protein